MELQQLQQLTGALGAYGDQMKLQQAAQQGKAGEHLHQQITQHLQPAKARQSHGQAVQAPHDPFTTRLDPKEEDSYQAWKAQWAPKDSGYDYDYRGAYKAGMLPDEKTGHWGDQYKKPNHPTYSVESVYAAEHGNPGHWTGKDGDIYIPGNTPRAVGGLDPDKVMHELTAGMIVPTKTPVPQDNGLLDPQKVNEYFGRP